MFEAIKFKFCSHKNVDIHAKPGSKVAFVKCYDCGNYFTTGDFGRVRFSKEDYYKFASVIYESCLKCHNIVNDDNVVVPEDAIRESVPFYDDFLAMKEKRQ
jgi:hypothetical protein